MRLARTLVWRSWMWGLGRAVLGCGLCTTACLPQLDGLQFQDDSSDSSDRPPPSATSTTVAPGSSNGPDDCAGCTSDGGVNPTRPAPDEPEPGECAPGTYLDEQAATCEECPEGSFSNGVNAPECVGHRVCPPGTYQSTPGTATRDVICSSCPSGTFASESGSKACREWSDCEPGEYVAVQGSADADRQCAACAEGETSSVVNSGACTAEGECSAGTVRLETDASSDVACRACAPGAYCAGGDHPEVECDDDSWDNDEPPLLHVLPRPSASRANTWSTKGPRRRIGSVPRVRTAATAPRTTRKSVSRGLAAPRARASRWLALQSTTAPASRVKRARIQTEGTPTCAEPGRIVLHHSTTRRRSRATPKTEFAARVNRPPLPMQTTLTSVHSSLFRWWMARS